MEHGTAAGVIDAPPPARAPADVLRLTPRETPPQPPEVLEARLRSLLGPGAGALLHRDPQGRVRLATTPPLSRAVMVPQPLTRNPLVALWRTLREWRIGRRGEWRSAQDAAAAVEDPEPHWRFAAACRRTVLLSLTIGQAALGTWFMTAVLPYHGHHKLEMALLAIYAVMTVWVSAGFWTAMLGFLVLRFGGDVRNINRTAAPPAREARTAILVPVCNEDVARVFAGLRATYESVRASGRLAQFEFFVLSDSDDPDVRVAELKAWADFCREANAFGRVFYRRRTIRLKRKSGNIADWCRRWGSSFRYMVVFDADSVMSGACLTRLVDLMEAHPRCGLIQTAPQATGRQTVYARIQQFAHRVYGPLFTAGLHFWQLGESHYWGHNAIIRVAPFIRHCALPKLPGKAPLGGEILSHDFVEAALMRRAGWTVWMAYDLPGSWEEMPPTLLEELRRDRRWCQGNLQNFRLFLAQGLNPAHRAVFITGVMAYLSAPLWFLFLTLSTASLALHTLTVPRYFSRPDQLFPDWPQWHPHWALALTAATLALLLLPKFLGALLAALDDARSFGGVARLFGSVLGETLFSALLAPVRMLFHTGFVVSTFVGHQVRWKSPPRSDARTTWPEALWHHAPGALLGALWIAGVAWINPHFLRWLLPVAGALIVAIPLSVASSRSDWGRALLRRRWFLTPEEADPSPELRALRQHLGETAADNFRRACIDPTLNALCCAAGRARTHLPAAVAAQRTRLVREALHAGPGGVPANARNALLSDPIALGELHELLWRTPGAHATWWAVTRSSSEVHPASIAQT